MQVAEGVQERDGHRSVADELEQAADGVRDVGAVPRHRPGRDSGAGRHPGGAGERDQRQDEGDGTLAVVQEQVDQQDDARRRQQEYLRRG